MALTLVIANKNYSSWSLRPWMALVEAGIPFTEKMIRFGEPRFGRQIRRVSKAGTVPVLIDGKLVISDSLAILEYLAERFPQKNLWPRDRAARALARSAAAEMHSSYAALRQACPMNLRRPPKPVPMSDNMLRDVARIEALWRQCRKAHGKGGPFLFGKFSNADAMFAPVATRFETYAIPVAHDTCTYMHAIFSTRAFTQWKSDSTKEKDRVEVDEVDLTASADPADVLPAPVIDNNPGQRPTMRFAAAFQRLVEERLLLCGCVSFLARSIDG